MSISPSPAPWACVKNSTGSSPSTYDEGQSRRRAGPRRPARSRGRSSTGTGPSGPHPRPGNDLLADATVDLRDVQFLPLGAGLDALRMLLSSGMLVSTLLATEESTEEKMSWHGPSIAASEKPFPRALATPSVTRR